MWTHLGVHWLFQQDDG